MGRPIWFTPSETRKQHTGGTGARFPKFVVPIGNFIRVTLEPESADDRTYGSRPFDLVPSTASADPSSKTICPALVTACFAGCKADYRSSQPARPASGSV